jgi:hypothetical protein
VKTGSSAGTHPNQENVGAPPASTSVGDSGGKAPKPAPDRLERQKKMAAAKESQATIRSL